MITRRKFIESLKRNRTLNRLIGNDQLLADPDFVGTVELVAVGLKNALILVGVAVEIFGDLL